MSIWTRCSFIVSSAYQQITHDGELSRASEVHQRNERISHTSSLRIGREQHVTDSSHHSLAFLIKLFNSSSPEGKLRREPAPLSPSTTNDLLVSIATSLHQSLPDLVPFSGMVHHLPEVQTQGNTDTDTDTDTHTEKHRHGHTQTHTHKKTF